MLVLQPVVEQKSVPWKKPRLVERRSGRTWRRHKGGKMRKRRKGNVRR
jgi:hypothetical protein